jgi:hypothetical protein
VHKDQGEGVAALNHASIGLSASRLQADTFAKITPSEPDDERVVASRDDEARPVLRGGADGAAPLYN